MNLARFLCLAFFCITTVAACDWWNGPKQVKSEATLKRAYWGLPADGLGADVTGRVTCPHGYPCDAFANPANYGDNKPDLNKRLTVIWTCQPQRFVLSEVVVSGLKVRMDCIGGPPVVPRTIEIIDATWGSGSASSTIDVTQQVRDICGADSTRCQVPAMAYIFGMPDRNAKMLRVRFTCNGQTTPGQQALENSVADLRCERLADLGY
ncbi:hypothetical protein [Reyranella sp.]|uniref:hypothetical protein n=1 Tax=Reyranella sp. TaxID=1929291 RepID=UPI003BAA9432